MDHYGGMVLNRGSIKISVLYDNQQLKSKDNSIHKDVPPKLKCPVCGESYQLEKLGNAHRGCKYRVWFFGKGHFSRCAEAKCPRCANDIAYELKGDRALVGVGESMAKKRGWIF